jgi:hypothetical protein
VKSAEEESASERAQAVCEMLGVGRFDTDTYSRIRRLFQEHAVDQRTICAEAVPTTLPRDLEADPAEAHAAALHRAHAAVLNARAPGEGA